MSKYKATCEWSWAKDDINVSVKPGDIVPDNLPESLVKFLLNTERIMPATTATPAKIAE